jgi:hypothetical protein
MPGCSNLYCYVWQVLREESTEATGAEEAETAAPLAAAADTSAGAREEPAQQEPDSNAGGRENLSEPCTIVADPGCLSRIRIFPSRIQGQKDSESRIRI